MKRRLTVLWWFVAVLAILQIAGGIVLLVHTAKKEAEYTYVECTVKEVVAEQNGDTFTVKDLIVTYEEEGETIIASMADYPKSFAEGSSFTARYSDDKRLLSAEKTDWFSPALLLCLGIAYAIGDIVALALQKKTGLYALQDADGGEEIEEDEWTLLTEQPAEQHKEDFYGSDSAKK